VNKPWEHHVNPDDLLRTVNCRGLGQTDEDEFARAIRRLTDITGFEAVERRTIDNGALLFIGIARISYFMHIHTAFKLVFMSPFEASSAVSASGTVPALVVPALLAAQSSLPNVASVPSTKASLSARLVTSASMNNPSPRGPRSAARPSGFCLLGGWLRRPLPLRE
jgi:hypothetical protein